MFPGAHEDVIAVGSFDAGAKAASTSSRGPNDINRVKPDVSAPGVSIRSAWSTADNMHNTISGTSMAAPHVTGIVALVLAAHLSWSYSDVVASLRMSANRSILKTATEVCGGIQPTTYPNNVYGYGAVDAAAALGLSPPVASAPTPAPTPAPTNPTKPPITDRCTGLGEQMCGELQCEWLADANACLSWL